LECLNFKLNSLFSIFNIGKDALLEGIYIVLDSRFIRDGRLIDLVLCITDDEVAVGTIELGDCGLHANGLAAREEQKSSCCQSGLSLHKLK